MPNPRVITGFCAVLFLNAGIVFGQSPSSVRPNGLVTMPPTMSARLIAEHPDPYVPKIAQLANVTDKVSVRFTVTPEGAVRDAIAYSGNPMLHAAAVDGVRLWKFHPYLVNGAPTAFATWTTIDFSRISPDRKPPADDQKLAKVRAINEKLQPMLQACNKRLQTHEKSSVDFCRQGAELTDTLPPEDSIISRIRAHDDYGLALLSYGSDPKKALAQFEIEIGLLPQVMTPVSIEYAVAYWHRASAHAELKEYEAAEKDFAAAEASMLAAGQFMPTYAVRAEAARKAIIAKHADLLEKEGKHDEAQKLLGPAASAPTPPPA